jgi:phosphatidylglycerophosphate synthase
MLELPNLMPPTPILILLPAPGQDGARVILGLGLVRRAVMAARRAGYRQVFVLSADGGATDGAARVPGWSAFAAGSTSSPTAPLVVAPAAILAETDWLERAAEARIEPAAWAAIPGRIVVVAAASASAVLDALEEEGARDLNAVANRLAGRFGPPAATPAGVDPIVVETPADVPLAEQRLMRGLVKDTDGFMARHVERPISLLISRLLAPTAVTPNQMSLVSIFVGICGGPFFLSSSALMQTVGSLFFLAHSILDGCDGELARLKFAESRWGGVLDFWGDNVVHSVIFACMGVGWSLEAGAAWPLALGAAAVLGTLGSAGFVYWRLMRSKEGGGSLFTSVAAEPHGAMARVLDSASRRDFIYLVLLLALFGKSNWFLLLAAIGAPVYLCLVVTLAIRERRSSRAAC